MTSNAKRRYKILFFVLPKTSKDDGVKKDKTFYKRTKHWIIGGVSILIGAIVAVYLKNNHEFVIDISNKVSEYINRYRSPEITSLEVHHIGFLKVHKAGGSTVQNVLFRFGLKRRLSFVMPVKGSQYKFSTYGGKCAQLFKSKSGYHDILALHSVFNESVYRQILPNDSVNIAIVREPLSLMISGAYFHRDIWKIQYLEVVPKDNFIKNLIRYPELYDPNEFSLTRNSMAMDFGFPRGFHVTDTAKIENYLEYLQSKFPLVMLVEHFDESMILLKRLLHWRLEDMLYIPLNVYKHPTEKELNISVIDRKKFQERNFLDVAIYRFFKENFIQTVSSLGTEFQNEVEYFRKIRISVEEYCVSKRQQKVTFVIEESKWNKQAVVLPSDCEAMLTNELDFIDKIRAVMRQNKAGKRLSSVT